VAGSCCGSYHGCRGDSEGHGMCDNRRTAVGLYTALAPMAIYAVNGSSRLLSV
jgi:hypothetical protein